MSATSAARPTRPATRYDLRLVRAVIDDIESGIPAHTVTRQHGLSSLRTVYRWRVRAAAYPGWPTAADIANQDAYLTENADRLRARRLAERAYRRQIYLQRGPMTIPIVGTSRRLQALMTIGWTQLELGAHLGVTGQRVSHLTLGRYPLIHRDIAAQVAALYDDLSMTVPQDAPLDERPPRYQAVHERQRRHMRARGWAAPLAWDDDTIDDPDAKPAVAYRPARGRDEIDPVLVQRVVDGDFSLVRDTTKPEKVAIVSAWRASGRPIAELERRAGWQAWRYDDRQKEVAA